MYAKKNKSGKWIGLSQVALICLLLLCAGAVRLRAQSVIATPTPNPSIPRLVISNAYEKPVLQATPLPFTKNDFIRAVRNPLKTEYFLGEPIDLSIRLVNHTDFKISVMTSNNPRASLDIKIQPIKPRPDLERPYYGPFKEGNYAPSPIALNPYDEYPLRGLIWGDLATANGLAFPTPGEYIVKVSLKVSAELSKAAGSIPLEPFTVNILPAPPDVAPLIEELGRMKAFQSLHLRAVPDGGEAKIQELADKYPKASITPYLNYALGLKSYSRMIAMKLDPKEMEQASMRLKLAGDGEFAYRLDALDSLGHLYDRFGAAELARDTCQKIVDVAPPDIATRHASTQLVRKYLGNTAQLDPIRYWDILQ